MSAVSGISTRAVSSSPVPHPTRDGASTAALGALLGAAPRDGVSFGPDELLTLVETNVRGIDGDLRSRMASLDGDSTELETLARRRADLTRALSATDEKKIRLDTVFERGDGTRTTVGDFLVAEGWLSPDELVDAGTKIARTRLEGFENSLKEESAALETGNDLEMLELQELLSRRSRIVQLATQVMAKLEDAKDRIVGNLR